MMNNPNKNQPVPMAPSGLGTPLYNELMTRNLMQQAPPGPPAPPVAGPPPLPPPMPGPLPPK